MDAAAPLPVICAPLPDLVDDWHLTKNALRPFEISPWRSTSGNRMKSIANPYPQTPTMAAGVADHIWTCEEIAGLLD